MCAAYGQYQITRAHGGTQSDAFKGATVSGVSSLVFQTINASANAAGQSAGFSAWAERTLVNGLAGATLSVMQGGKFGHGFVSAGGSAALTPVISAGADQGYYSGLVVSTVIGGSISSATGGKFANGAASAAMGYVLTGFVQKSSESAQVDDYGFKWATSEEERRAFAEQNVASIGTAMEDISDHFPELRPYLEIGGILNSSDHRVWRWRGGIFIPGPVMFGEVLVTYNSLATGLAHEAMHGYVFAIDQNYRSNGFATMDWSTLTGRPHSWIYERSTQIGTWLGDMKRKPQLKPNISSGNYWQCVNTGAC